MGFRTKSQKNYLTPKMAAETNVFMAKLSEQAERYDEMIYYMKEVVKDVPQLSLEQRNLLSVAYKNVVGARRASLRIIQSINAKESNKDPNGPSIKWIRDYSDQVEEELEKLCDDILQLLDGTLIANLNATSDEGDTSIQEAKVFYNKMKADYCRYLAEFKQDTEEDKAKTRVSG